MSESAAADRSDPQVVSASIIVAASPEVVFAIVADPHQHPRIDGSGSLRGTIEGPERLARGDTFGMSMTLFGLPYKISNHVVELEPDRLIAWRHFGAHRWRYELEPTPLTGGRAGTRVTETWDASRYGTLTYSALRLAGFPARNRAGILGTLDRLKQAAEADEPSDPEDHSR